MKSSPICFLNHVYCLFFVFDYNFGQDDIDMSVLWKISTHAYKKVFEWISVKRNLSKPHSILNHNNAHQNIWAKYRNQTKWDRNTKRWYLLFLNFWPLVLKILLFESKLALREKCPYSELFWSAFSRFLTEYGEMYMCLSVFSPNAGKCGPE